MRLLRTILVWTCTGAALAGWWALRGGPGVAVAAGSATPVFAGDAAFDPERVTTIRLERRDGSAWTFAREGGAAPRWIQSEPFRAELDPYSARQLATLSASLVALRDAPLAADARPVATLRLKGEGFERVVELLRRGVAGRAFVRVGERTYVTDAALFERAVETDPKEWRSRSLFPETLGRVDRIRRISREGTIELAREGERWSMRSPIKTRADRARLEELVAAIGRSRSDGFLFDQPKDLAPFGLDQPVRTLSVDFAGEAGVVTRSLLIGAPVGVGTDANYALIEGVPSVLRLNGATRDMLLPPDALLVDPTATAARAADVKRVEIRGKEGSIELVRALDQWTVAPIEGGQAGAALPAQGAVVEALLATLTKARATELSFSGFPAELEVATILLFGFDGKPLDIVRVARDPKTSRWGFENGDGALRVHPAATDVPLGLVAFTGG